MISHPLFFLFGYLVLASVLSFGVVGPLTEFMTVLLKRRLPHKYLKGVWLGASVVSLFFMVLHYLLYLRGYAITDWSRLFHDIFYPANA